MRPRRQPSRADCKQHVNEQSWKYSIRDRIAPFGCPGGNWNPVAWRWPWSYAATVDRNDILWLRAESFALVPLRVG